MRIRRFVAADMRSALQMVRDAHGPDAVILSNRRTDEGIEIVAASNYDEDFVQRAIEDTRRETVAEAAPPAAAPVAETSRPPAPVSPATPATPAPTAAPAQANAATNGEAPRTELAPSEIWLQSLASPGAAARDADAPPTTARPTASAAPVEPDPAPSALAQAEAGEQCIDGPTFAEILAAGQSEAAELEAAQLAPAPAPSRPVPVPDPPAPASHAEMVRLREELAQMRQMIEREMVRLTDERLRGSPVRAQTMDLMDEYGFDAGITRDVVMEIPADTEAHRARGLMLGLISRRLPICPIDPLEEAGVIALVGPTGAGKTTTIAKLAARYAAKHQARDVALVTTDTVRVGGREQLYSYGRELGIAVHEADSEAGLLQLLQRLQDYRLVLVDTAGLSQRDRALASQLHWLRAARQARTLLVLPANTHFSDLDEVVRRFQVARPQGVVLTKLDETSRLGSALSVVADHELPLTWTTDGQRIPDDLARANAARLVLRLEVLRREADKPFAPEYQDAIA